MSKYVADFNSDEMSLLPKVHSYQMVASDEMSGHDLPPCQSHGFPSMENRWRSIESQPGISDVGNNELLIFMVYNREMVSNCWYKEKPNKINILACK